MNQTSRSRDPRLVGSVSVIWIVASVLIMTTNGATDNQFFAWSFGPTDHLQLLGVKIDTWGKYSMLCVFVAIDAGINVWVLEVVHTWLNNNIYRAEVQTEHGDRWAMFIALALNIYTCVHNIIMLFLMLSQVDIQIIVIVVNVVLTTCIVDGYLRAKLHTVNFQQIALRMASDDVV